MKTEDLIRALSRDGVVERRSEPRQGIGLALLCAFVIGAVFLLVIGPRPDLAQSVGLVALKVATVALVAWGGLELVGRLWRPGTVHSRAAAAFAAAAMLMMTWLVGSAVLTPANVTAGLFGANAVHCLLAIPLMAFPTLAVLTWAARGAAVTRLDLAGAAAGLAAAGMAAVFYALNCTGDSPLFVAVWYTLAGAIVCAAGVVAFRRFVSW